MPTTDQLKQLASSLEGKLMFDELHITLYSTDASAYKLRPVAAALPKSDADIVKLLAFAKEHKISLTPRTAGTSLAGQTVGSGIIVDVSKYFTNIVSFDKINKFFETMPQLQQEIEIENPKTKVKSKIVLKGAQDFFVLPSLTTT